MGLIELGTWETTLLMATIKVLIADDHDLMRRGIKAIIETKRGWEICGEAQTGVQAVAKAKEESPTLNAQGITSEMDACWRKLSELDIERSPRRSLSRAESG